MSNLVDLDFAMQGSENSARRFQMLWERGDGLKDNPTELIDAAAMTILYCIMVQEKGGLELAQEI